MKGEAMNKYLKEHEQFIIRAMEDPKIDQNWLANYHKTQIGFLQQERLVHLLVMLAVALFLILFVGLSLLADSIYFLLADGILLILLVFYVVHYYQLENGVQRWYRLYNKIVNSSDTKGETNVK
jgi:cell division protein FtsW (lipid II flippase)